MHTPDPTPDPEELPAMVPNTFLATVRTQPFANETRQPCPLSDAPSLIVESLTNPLLSLHDPIT